METWPPLARKSAALAILASLLFGMVTYLVIPMLGFVAQRVGELSQSRFELARLERFPLDVNREGFPKS